MNRITPSDLAAWRRSLAQEGDGEHVDPTLAQQLVPRLMSEVEHLWEDIQRQRLEFASKAAGALERRLQVVADYNNGGCPKCRDAEARAFLVKLRRDRRGLAVTRPAATLTLIAALLAPTVALAWGSAGHEIVAAIAEERLTPAARSMVHEIVGDVPLSAPEICTWADTHRSPTTGKWHYVNIPFSAARYDPARHCPRGACAVAAVERAEAELVRESEPARRLEALRFLVHVVADLHQPLHAGDGWDRGGNDLRVRLGRRREPTNLHHVWDTEVVKPLFRDGGALSAAHALERALPAGEAEAWAAQLDPASWANESNREARAIYGALEVRPTERGIVQLPRDYVVREEPRVAAALQRAGVRLAAVLDRIATQRRR